MLEELDPDLEFALDDEEEDEDDDDWDDDDWDDEESDEVEEDDDDEDTPSAIAARFSVEDPEDDGTEWEEDPLGGTWSEETNNAETQSFADEEDDDEEDEEEDDWED